MYHAIIRNKVKKTFQLVNEHRYADVVKEVIPTVKHSFAGDHALGGTRNDREAFEAWLQRLGRLMPPLHLTIARITVKGWPHNTLAIVEWKAVSTLENGEPYTNEGAHFITIKWGKVAAIKVYEDSLAVAHALDVQYASGIDEAKAAPIIS
jgi:ketosteroid isomerase-like protein